MAARGVELDPSNAIALIEQIWISWYEKDFAAAKVQMEAALKANPYEALVQASVGSFYASTGVDGSIEKTISGRQIRTFRSRKRGLIMY